MLLIVLSLVPAAACFGTFATWLPSSVDRYEDYGAAEPCPAGVATRAREECVRTVTFVVEDTEVRKSGQNSTFEATVSGTPFWDGVVAFGDPGPLLERLGPGDDVTGTVWRGDVMTLSRDGVRQSTSDEPRDDFQMTAAIGTFAGLLAVLLFAFGTVRVANPRSYEPFVWRPVGLWLIITMGIASFAFGFAALLLGVPWGWVPPVSVAVVLGVARLIHRRTRPAGAR
ncbi:hypothetical protein [Streptomyces sp. RFCAC02]|uniref:hypothetical protein n=1 Tax=Streptomyces sp. RFCAC02 TaxID=2499143 RepID=UPI0010218C74|nr:hypothetical protein [Streptomyces sp. RFCAC02]